MKEQLRLLEELQGLDVLIYDLELRKDEIPDRIEDENEGRGKLQQQRQELQSKRQQLQDERNEKARHLDLDRIRMRNLTNKENQITGQKDYELYIKEIDTLEQETKEHERTLKEAEQRLSEADSALSVVDSKIGVIDRTVADLKEQGRKIDAEIDSELEELYEKRNSLEGRIQGNLLDHYIKVSDTNPDGMAIAFTRDGHCMSCHMAIRPQMFNELLKGDVLHTCPSCRRILVYREELPSWFRSRQKTT